MTIDLNTLSPADLETLISTAEKRKVALKNRKPIAEVREKLVRIATRENYTLGELFPTAQAHAENTATPAVKRASKRVSKVAGNTKRATKARAGGQVPAKYCNPENPNETWSGRGKPPRWMSALLAQGKNKDDFLI